jgi:vacuolar protein sorting-associated protein 35
VGKNLTYISQLDGLSFELYAGSVLPRLLEQVGGSRNAAAVTTVHATSKSKM